MDYWKSDRREFYFQQFCIRKVVIVVFKGWIQVRFKSKLTKTMSELDLMNAGDWFVLHHKDRQTLSSELHEGGRPLCFVCSK